MPLQSATMKAALSGRKPQHVTTTTTTLTGDNSAPANGRRILMLVLVAVVVAIFHIITTTTPTIPLASAAPASGPSIDFVSIGDYGNSSKGQILQIYKGGIEISVALQNLRGGINGSPLNVIIYNNDDNGTLNYDILTSVLASSPNLAGVFGLTSEDAIPGTMKFVNENSMSVLQPLAGSGDFLAFNESYMHFVPTGDAEFYTMVRHAIYAHQVTRVAIVAEELGGFGTARVPGITALIESVGAKITYVMPMNVVTNPNGYNQTHMAALLATKPHAVLLLGSIYGNTAAVMIALLFALPDALIYTNSGNLGLVDYSLKQLPTTAVIKDRVLLTSYGPLYSDLSFDVIKRFRADINVVATAQMNLAIIDAFPLVGMYVFFGWLSGELMGSIVRRIHTVNGASVRQSIFSDSIYALDDFLLGPYTPKCSGQRSQICGCNSGARMNSLIRYTEALVLAPAENSNYTIPYTECTGVGLPLASVMVTATVSPNTTAAITTTHEYMTGRNAAAGFGDAEGIVIQQTYAGNSTAALQYLNTEKLLTAFAGTILNIPIGDATGIGAVIDPMEVRPRLYGGFRRDVVYVSPTYEQELHALASLAVAQGKGITVLSALDDDGSAVGSTLTRSMNTLGKEGGGHRSSASIASGLLATGDGGVTILHGIATSADIAAIATHLAQQTNAVVAIPMAHLLVWYRELVATVTDESQRSRIVFATSLPNWAGPVTGETTGPALQTYFDRVPATNRTPGSLRGFMTHQLLTYVSSRVPVAKSPTEFLRMLYGASVIVMDTGLVAGPYFDGACGSSASGSCEMNIGARVIRVRSLSASVTASNGSASGRDESSITLDSGRISYKGLPTTDNSLRNIIIIVAVVGGLLVIGGVVALILICLCSGRSNRTAPKDESDAFTIIFTDIQSSTNLWAEAPEAMAPALDHHHALIRKLCNKHRGYEVKTIGDAFMIAFRDAVDAVNLSSALQFDFFNDKTWSQQIDHAYLEMDHCATLAMKLNEKAMYSTALSQEDYGKVWNGLRVRIGIHTGFGEIKKDPVSHGYDYYGTVVNTAARTEAIAHGGQVIMTEAAVNASNVPRDRIEEMGPVMLRGVPDPIQMYQLHTIPNRVFPPLRVEKAQEEGVDAVDGGGSSASRQSLRSSNQSPAALHQRIIARNVLGTVVTVMPVAVRDAWLADLCKKWRIQIPTTGGLKSEDTSSSPRALSEALLDSLSTKVGNILVRKVNAHGGGGESQGDHHRSSASHRSSIISGAAALRVPSLCGGGGRLGGVESLNNSSGFAPAIPTSTGISPRSQAADNNTDNNPNAPLHA